MMTSKFKFFLIFLFFGTSIQLYAQYGMGKVEEIEAVQARKLIVMIEEPRERMLNKIAKRPKKGTVQDYKADLATYNENIKAAVEKFWPYNKKDIQYKTFNEIMELRKTKTQDYAVIACLSSEPRSMSAGYNYAQGLYWVKDIKEDFEDRDDAMFTVMLVNTIEDFGKRPVFYLPLFDVFPTKASMVYGIKNIEAYFNLRISTKKNGTKMRDEQERTEEEMSKKAGLLAEKTLLIREEWLDKELTEANLKNYYPYKYKICDRAFMDNVVMNLDSKYAYGVVLPYVMSNSHSNYIMYYQYAFDAADSKIMCFVKPSTGGAMLASGVTGKAGNRNFTIKVIMKMVEQVKGKSK
jgi:hypothetical protein